MPGGDDTHADTDRLPFSETAEQALQRVSDAFFALNHDWEFTYVNAAAATLLDRPADELVGKNVWKEFPEATESAFKGKYETAMAMQSPVHFEEYDPTLETWFSVRAYPSETGLSVYFKDVTVGKEYKARLETIHETTRKMMRAETPGKIADIAAESVRDVLGFPAVTFYLWDEECGVLEPAAATETVARRYDGDLPTLDGDESLLWDVFVDGETRLYAGSQPPHEEMYNPDPDVQRRVVVPLANHGVFVAGTETHGAIDDLTVDLLEILAENVTAAVERAKREQSIVERDEALRRTNEQLSNLKNVNKILWEIDRTLIQATRRSEVERAVCEKLTEIDGYELAWFGRPEMSADEFTLQGASNPESSYLDQLFSADYLEETSIPAVQALQANEPVFTDNVLDASSRAWRKEALDEGYRSIASLPVQFNETTYGVLEICADRPSAFSEEERTVLRELGEVIGNALNAIERKEALVADAGVELTIRTEDETLAARMARALNSEVVVESILPRQDETWLVYLTVVDADPSVVLEELAQFLVVDDAEHIRSVAEGELFGLTLTDLPDLDFFAEHGVTTTSILATSVETELTFEAPQSVDVRSFLEACRSVYERVELVGRRPVTPGEQAEATPGLLSDLTDQQRGALQAALKGGYFAWPRDSTGEEIAESLGVTPPTFHRHLRVALQKVVSGVLNDDAI